MCSLRSKFWRHCIVVSLVCTLCLTNFHRPGICIYRSGVALRNCLFKHTKRRRPNASSYKQISISLVTGVCINSNSATTLLKKKLSLSLEMLIECVKNKDMKKVSLIWICHECFNTHPSQIRLCLKAPGYFGKLTSAANLLFLYIVTTFSQNFEM